MPQSVTVRRAERKDEEALVNLWLALQAEQAALDGRFRLAEDAEERWRNDFPGWLKAERRRVLVAEQGGKAVGFITAQRTAPPPIYELVSELFVEELFVMPEARTHGVAAALLAEVKAWGAEIGAGLLRLGALASNEEARAFWEHQGARPYAVTYLLELEAVPDEGSVKPKAKLGF